jgi:hypothetical protein
MASNKRMQFKEGTLLKRKWSGAWKEQPKYILILEILPSESEGFFPRYRVLDITNNKEAIESKYSVEGSYAETIQ